MEQQHDNNDKTPPPKDKGKGKAPASSPGAPNDGPKAPAKSPAAPTDEYDDYARHFTSATRGYYTQYIESINRSRDAEMDKLRAETYKRHKEIQAKTHADVMALVAKRDHDHALLKQHAIERVATLNKQKQDEINEFAEKYRKDPVAVIMRHEEIAGKVKWEDENDKKGERSQFIQQQGGLASLTLHDLPTPRDPEASSTDMVNRPPGSQPRSVPPFARPGLSQAVGVSRPAPAPPTQLGGNNNSARRYVWQPPPDVSDDDNEEEESSAPKDDRYVLSDHPKSLPFSRKTTQPETGFTSRKQVANKSVQPTHKILNPLHPMARKSPPPQNEKKRIGSLPYFPPGPITKPQTAFLLKTLATIKAESYTRFFRNAVDPQEFNVPEYYNVIKKPMYIVLLEHNLKNNTYGSLKEFMQDFELILANTRKFNGEKHEVTEAGKVMDREFRRMLKGMPGVKASGGPLGGMKVRDGKGSKGAPVEIDD